MTNPKAIASDGGASCERTSDPWRSDPARIVRITDEIPGVRTYELEFVDAAVRETFRFTAGQFNMLYLPGIGEAAISISSDLRHPATLAHTVRAVGNVTDALARLHVGDSVLLRGPFGKPWPIAQDGSGGTRSGGKRDIVLVGGGLGLASQRSAILDLAHRRAAFRRVVVIHGAKQPDGLLYAREYDVWRAAGIEVEVVVDRPDGSWRGRVGNVTTVLESLPLDPANTTILSCGPDAMMVAVARTAMRRGVDDATIFLSLERNMACAVRHCGLCQFGPVFVCQDGPVFPYDRIASYLAVPRL